MDATGKRFRPIVGIAAGCAAVLGMLTAIPSATKGETIRIWKIGSPHSGDTPRATLPPSFVRESAQQGVGFIVETFPAKGFSKVFSDALRANAPPDLLVIDNMGVIDGITTALGRFDGIAQDPTVRRDLIRVTGAFDELLGPQRGWTFLFVTSPNHRAARTLSLLAPRCAARPAEPTFSDTLRDMVPKLAAAYLERRESDLLPSADPERLTMTSVGPESVNVGLVRTCRLWGNTRLAFASVKASYDADTTIGHAEVLLVLRRPADRWQLLVAARDPVSNDKFLREAQGLSALQADNARAETPAQPATHLAPADTEFPVPAAGERFGTFTWLSSASEDVIAEIGEFVYKNDARLFVTRPRYPGSPSSVSTGALWTTSSTWSWRVWSITRSGSVTFSDVRTFVH